MRGSRPVYHSHSRSMLKKDDASVGCPEDQELTPGGPFVRSAREGPGEME